MCRSLHLVGELPSNVTSGDVDGGERADESTGAVQGCRKWLVRSACALVFLAWAAISILAVRAFNPTVAFIAWPLAVTLVVVGISVCRARCCSCTVRCQCWAEGGSEDKSDLSLATRGAILLIRVIAATGEDGGRR